MRGGRDEDEVLGGEGPPAGDLDERDVGAVVHCEEGVADGGDVAGAEDDDGRAVAAARAELGDGRARRLDSRGVRVGAERDGRRERAPARGARWC